MSGEERVMFTVGRWRQCQLFLGQALSACTCVLVCVWMIQQLVQRQQSVHSSSTSAQVHSGQTGANKQLLFTCLPAAETASEPLQVGRYCRRPRSAGAVNRPESSSDTPQQHWGFVLLHLPLDFILIISIYRAVIACRGSSDSPRVDLTRTRPDWHTAGFIQTPQLVHFRILTSDAPTTRQVSFSLSQHMKSSCEWCCDTLMLNIHTLSSHTAYYIIYRGIYSCWQPADSAQGNTDGVVNEV